MLDHGLGHRVDVVDRERALEPTVRMPGTSSRRCWRAPRMPGSSSPPVWIWKKPAVPTA